MDKGQEVAVHLIGADEVFTVGKVHKTTDRGITLLANVPTEEEVRLSKALGGEPPKGMLVFYPWTSVQRVEYTMAEEK